MVRYDIHAGDDGYYYVDIQADSLSHLNTRVVIPLMPLDTAPFPARRLNPTFEFGGKTVSLVTQYLGTSRVAALGPVVGSLASEHDRVTAALDRLFQGI